MKIQLAYRFSEENKEEVINMLEKICSALKERGHDTYCAILNPNSPKEKKELFLDTLKRLNDADAILAFVKSEEKSEGMLMEVGHAMALGKKLILAIRKDIVNTHLREFADKVIEFSSLEELYTKIKKIKNDTY